MTESKWKDFKNQEHRVRSARAEEESFIHRDDDRRIVIMEKEANTTTRVLKEKRKMKDGMKNTLQQAQISGVGPEPTTLSPPWLISGITQDPSSWRRVIVAGMPEPGNVTSCFFGVIKVVVTTCRQSIHGFDHLSVGSAGAQPARLPKWWQNLSPTMCKATIVSARPASSDPKPGKATRSSASQVIASPTCYTHDYDHASSQWPISVHL